MEIKEILENTLRKEPNLLNDKGEIKKWVVINKAQNYDETLLGLLLDEPRLKSLFFKEIKKAWVFNLNLFTDFIEQKEFLPDSYTGFPNKIGLQIDGKFLRQRNEISLVWPYKDCVLEGGQSREEDGRKEIFFNELLAQDEITQLFEPKVITNVQYFGDTKELTPTSNLLIKGNNLLALHSLKKQFAGKVKLIYIDPPYNTGSDGFRYNDSFKQSSWLTFMKNRIEIAKSLLSDKGFFFIHISFHQFAYLKALMDEVFNNNEVCVFNLLVRHPNRILKADKDFHDVIEYILVYTKNKVLNKIAKRVEENDIDKYTYSINELHEGEEIEINGIKVRYFEPQQYELVKTEPKIENFQRISIRGSLKEGNSSGRFYEKHIAPIKGNFPPLTIFKIPDMGNDIYDYRYFYTPEESKSNGGYFQGVPKDQKDFKEKPYPNFLDFVQDFNNVGYEGNVAFRNGKKPETLIKQIFEIGKIKRGDIVLDYHVGSGTTAAVAHKMGVQYIGIEQMDYIETITSERLKATIEGEQEGISKAVNWHGGGNFVYLELKKYNENFIEKIRDSQSTDDLLEVWEEMKKVSFLNYNIDLKDQNNAIDELKTHSFEIQKQKLASILDKNQLYVSISNMDDAQYGVTQEEKEFTKAFYQND
jgi:adenine-specific DNA-methyltransferase